MNPKNSRDRRRQEEDLETKRDQARDKALLKADTAEKRNKILAIHAAQEVVDKRIIAVQRKKADVEAAEATYKEAPSPDNAARVTTKKTELEEEERLLKIDEETLATAKKA